MPGILTVLGIIVVIIIVLLLLIALFTSFFTVHTQTAVPIERFGKFDRIAHAGLHLKLPFVETAQRPISMRVQQLDVQVETKTLDNVFVQALIAVQYQVRDVVPGEDVLDSGVYAAAYRLENPTQQIESYVFDSVRSFIPTLELDHVFTSKNEIAESVQQTLVARMADFGYIIINTLVPDITPDIKVKNAMNEINASERLKQAAANKADANKIMLVKNAEAERESKILHGQGVAGQREAIAEGLRHSLVDVQQANVNSDQSMQILMTTMMLDAYERIGANGRSTTLFLPTNPSGLMEQITAATSVGQRVADDTEEVGREQDAREAARRRDEQQG